jgi:hypothetical protein
MAEQQQTGGTNTPAKAAKEEAVVEYVGTADVRKISAADWKKAGVEDHKQVSWDADNGHKVPVSDLSKEALEVLKSDTGFKVPEA